MLQQFSSWLLFLEYNLSCQSNRTFSILLVSLIVHFSTTQCFEVAIRKRNSSPPFSKYFLHPLQLSSLFHFDITTTILYIPRFNIFLSDLLSKWFLFLFTKKTDCELLIKVISSLLVIINNVGFISTLRFFTLTFIKISVSSFVTNRW